MSKSIIKLDDKNKEFLDVIKSKLQENTKKKVTYDDAITYLLGEELDCIEPNPNKNKILVFIGTPNQVLWASMGKISIPIFKYNGKLHLYGEDYD